MEKYTYIYCDGGARGNPGPAASAFLVKSGDEVVFKQSEFLGKATNNVAEYRAVILALKWLRDNYKNLKYKKVVFVIDSQLIVQQINGIFKVKDENMREHFYSVKTLEKDIELPLSYRLVRRENNKEADRLVNERLDEN